ncbi:hypothetical protein JHW43_005283 [Diplocarpon mali]|nr:hypothetical protein JHW43_005283 [Diplocarpon mali]
MRASRSPGHALLAAVCLATSITARSAEEPAERQSTCPGTAQSRCSQSGLPENFCCPSNSSCIALAGNTTVLCCPGGATDCSTIRPITCDMSSQNATLYPDNALKTTALDVPLTPCAGKCCPFGYGCDDRGDCVMAADQRAVPGSSAASSSSSPSPSTSAASASSSASASTATPIITAATQCSSYPAPGVVVGLFSGLVAGSALTLALICLLGAQRRQKSRQAGSSGSSLGNISDPQPSRDMRSDFLRRLPPPPPPPGLLPSRRLTVQRVRSLFRRDHDDVPPPVPLKVRRPPLTPPLPREPSFEDISIFADGDTASSLREQERAGADPGGLGLPPPRVGVRRQGHETTFSDLMERSGLAGLQEGPRGRRDGTGEGATRSAGVHRGSGRVVGTSRAAEDRPRRMGALCSARWHGVEVILFASPALDPGLGTQALGLHVAHDISPPLPRSDLSESTTPFVPGSTAAAPQAPAPGARLAAGSRTGSRLVRRCIRRWGGGGVYWFLTRCHSPYALRPTPYTRKAPVAAAAAAAAAARGVPPPPLYAFGNGFSPGHLGSRLGRGRDPTGSARAQVLLEAPAVRQSCPPLEHRRREILARAHVVAGSAGLWTVAPRCFRTPPLPSEPISRPVLPKLPRNTEIGPRSLSGGASFSPRLRSSISPCRAAHVRCFGSSVLWPACRGPTGHTALPKPGCILEDYILTGYRTALAEDAANSQELEPTGHWSGNPSALTAAERDRSSPSGLGRPWAVDGVMRRHPSSWTALMQSFGCK